VGEGFAKKTGGKREGVPNWNWGLAKVKARVLGGSITGFHPSTFFLRCEGMRGIPKNLLKITDNKKNYMTGAGKKDAVVEDASYREKKAPKGDQRGKGKPTDKKRGDRSQEKKQTFFRVKKWCRGNEEKKEEREGKLNTLDRTEPI